MKYENNERLREYLDRGASGAYREYLKHPRFEFDGEAFGAALEQVCAQFPEFSLTDAQARAAFRLLTSGVAPEIAMPLPSTRVRATTFLREKSARSWPWLKLFWAISVLILCATAVVLLTALVARAEPSPQQMQVIRRAMRGVNLLALSAAAAPQQPGGIILQFQQAGSPLATRPAGLVAFNCGTGMNCSFSGTTFTLTSTGAGGSGCVPPGTPSRLLYDDGAGGCLDTGLTWSGSTATAPTGVTLTYSGSGIINARKINGTEFSNTESLGKIPIGQGDGTAVWADPLVQGLTSHDAVGTSTNPVLTGGYASAAAPTDVSNDGDAVRAWFLRNGSQVFNLASGGTLVTLGQKAMSGSLPVTFASDQSALNVNTHAVTQSGTWNINNISGTISLPTGAATSANQTTANTSLSSIDTKLEQSRTADYDAGAGTVNTEFVGIALPAAGGPVAGGTSTNPVRVDPTGTTTQPVSGTVTANAGTGNFTVVQSTGSNLHVVCDSGCGGGTQYVEDAASAGAEQLTLAGAIRQDTPSATTNADGDYANLKTDSVGRLWVNGSGVTQSVSGAVTANAGTGTFTVGQATGSNLHTVLDSGTLTSITNTVTAQGAKTNNNAAPGATNLGVLSAIANASAPSLTEGNQVGLSVDLAGALRVSGSSGGGVAQTQVRDGSNNWTDVGYNTGNLNLPTQNVTDGATGSAVPAWATMAGGSDGTNLRALSVSTAGALNVNNISGTVSLPTGAATESTLSTLNGKVTTVDTGNVTISALPNEGQQTMANSVSVAIASNQSAVPASQSGTWTVQPGNTANTTPWRTTLSNGGNDVDVAALTNSNALATVLVDANGDQITSFGGGTQYAEDTAHSTGDTLTMAGVVQQSADAALSGDGDRSLLQVDANGFLKVNIKAGAGSGGTASADNSAFTFDTTNLTPMGAVVDDTGTNAVSENSVGTPRMTANRILKTDWSTLNGTTIDVGEGTGNAGTARVALSTNSRIAGGFMSNNNSSPSGNNLGVLPCLTNTSAPTWANGNQTLLSCTTGGLLRTDGSAVTQPVSGTVTANAGTGTFTVGQATASNLNATVVGTGTFAVQNTQQGTASQNVAQIAGNTTLTGNGATGTGAQRVTLSNDNTAIANWGQGATGSAVPASAQQIAGVGTGNLTAPLACDSYAFYDASTNGATQLVALTSSQTIYVCGYTFSSSASTANTLKLVYGTGTNCGTGQTAMTPGAILQAAASTGPVGKVVPVSGWSRGLKTAASNALCVLTNAAQAAQVEIWYTKF